MERGDPQLVAAPVFTIGSIALAFQLVDYVGQAAVGAPLAIILGCTGIFLLASTLWAAYAGQSFVAASQERSAGSGSDTACSCWR